MSAFVFCSIRTSLYCRMRVHYVRFPGENTRHGSSRETTRPWTASSRNTSNHRKVNCCSRGFLVSGLVTVTPSRQSRQFQSASSDTSSHCFTMSPLNPHRVFFLLPVPPGETRNIQQSNRQIIKTLRLVHGARHLLSTRKGSRPLGPWRF